jgi:adenylate cyclase
MYVSGHGTRANSVYVSEADLESHVRFTELVAQFIGSVRQVRLLQDERSRLNSFFPTQVIDSLTNGSKSRSLDPAEREITVLFCDVRGFSKKAERFKDDLLGLLGSVRAALGIMVDGILEQDGTIADFQGDDALGFRGWPVELKYGPIPAFRAALAIQKKSEEAS